MGLLRIPLQPAPDELHYAGLDPERDAQLVDADETHSPFAIGVLGALHYGVYSLDETHSPFAIGVLGALHYGVYSLDVCATLRRARRGGRDQLADPYALRRFCDHGRLLPGAAAPVGPRSHFATRLLGRVQSDFCCSCDLDDRCFSRSHAVSFL